MNIRNDRAYTPLHVAAEKCEWPLVFEQLLQAGCDVNLLTNVRFATTDFNATNNLRLIRTDLLHCRWPSNKTAIEILAGRTVQSCSSSINTIVNGPCDKDYDENNDSDDDNAAYYGQWDGYCSDDYATKPKNRKRKHKKS